MRQLLIDDFRTWEMIDGDGRYARPHEGAERMQARTFDEGIMLLRDEGPWDMLYLDHDLGAFDSFKTGYGIMCFLEEHPEKLPVEIIFVTDNPVGREAMVAALNSIRRR